MSKVITFSRTFPSYHPRKGEPTYFVEQLQNSLCLMNIPMFGGKCDPPMSFLKSLTKQNVGYKHHTIRPGHRFKVGDWFTPKVWGTDINPKSGRSGPYHSKPIIIAPDIQVKKVWDFDFEGTDFYLDGRHDSLTNPFDLNAVCHNDGLSFTDFFNWFTLSPEYKKQKQFNGQIICWNENIEY